MNTETFWRSRKPSAHSRSVNIFAKSAIAFNPGSSQAGSSSTNESFSTFQTSSNTSRRRHKINLVLSNLEDIKVVEGDLVEVGALISDRTTERTKLQAKKQRLSTAIARARLPLKELKPVPVLKFQTELIALKQAQFQLDTIVRRRSKVRATKCNLSLKPLLYNQYSDLFFES